MLKILQFTSIKCGGAESVLMNYYRALDKQKVHFDFLVFSNEKEFFEDEILAIGGNIYKADPNNRLNTGKKLLRELASNNKYNAIEIHTENAHSVIWVMMAYWAGFKKVIVHSHSTSNVKMKEHIIGKFLLNLFPIVRFSCGEAATEFMFGNNSAYIVNNAIDLSKYAYNEQVRNKLRHELGISNELVLGHVGRFIKLKNHELILRICKAFLDDGKNIKVLLLGDGETRKEIEEKAYDLGISSNVIFTGNVKNVFDYLQVMDVFVLPSYYEGFPTVAVEAQCAGIKCLLSDSITKDVKITELVSFLSINKDALVWKKEIEKLCPYNHINTKNELMLAGFDINTESNRLIQKYLSLGAQNE